MFAFVQALTAEQIRHFTELIANITKASSKAVYLRADRINRTDNPVLIATIAQLQCINFGVQVSELWVHRGFHPIDIFIERVEFGV